MKYSASTGGFYDPKIHRTNIPSDAVYVDAPTYAALMAAQANGNRIEPDQDGNPVVVGPSFADAQEAKRTTIRERYALEAMANVEVAGLVWDGGFDSAIKLDAAKRLAEAAGASDVTFFDADNDPHLLDFATAQTIVISVASAFQVALATKQALMRAVSDAQTDSDLDQVEWPQ